MDNSTPTRRPPDAAPAAAAPSGDTAKSTCAVGAANQVPAGETSPLRPSNLSKGIGEKRSGARTDTPSRDTPGRSQRSPHKIKRRVNVDPIPFALTDADEQAVGDAKQKRCAPRRGRGLRRRHNAKSNEQVAARAKRKSKTPAKIKSVASVASKKRQVSSTTKNRNAVMTNDFHNWARRSTPRKKGRDKNEEEIDLR